MYVCQRPTGGQAHFLAARGDIGGGVHRGSLRDLKLRTTLGGHLELGAVVSTKAVWWNLLLASLLTHLYLSLCNYFGF